MTRRKTTILVLLAGTTVGTGVAVADREQTTKTAPLPPLPGPAHSVTQRLAGPARIVARAADPNGGPPWAVRRLPIATSGGRNARGLTCLQLGRISDGRFGWISDGYAFAPADTSATVVPQNCFPPGAPLRGHQLEVGLSSVARLTIVEGAATGAPRPSTVIIFGELPAGGTRARLTDGTPLTPQSGRTVLTALKARRVGEPTLDGLLSRTGRPPLRFRVANTERVSRDRSQLPQPGTQHVAVRAPDPAGGAAWGLLSARTRTGGFCLSGPDRLVGNTPSLVDSRLGIAIPAVRSRFDCRRASAPTAAHPLKVSTSSYANNDEDPALTAQLRRPIGRLVLYGRTTPSVTSVTIRSPRDIRTVKPSLGSGAFVAVYDGTFQNQAITVTAHLPGGRSVSITRRSF